MFLSVIAGYATFLCKLSSLINDFSDAIYSVFVVYAKRYIRGYMKKSGTSLIYSDTGMEIYSVMLSLRDKNLSSNCEFPEEALKFQSSIIRLK